MNFRRFIGCLLAILVISGLVAAPLISPAAAKRLPVGEMSDMAAMSGDMSCCPDKQKTNDCQDCPLVAMCMLTIASAVVSPASGISVSFSARTLFFVLDDLMADGLIGDPPDHPPRILV